MQRSSRTPTSGETGVPTVRALPVFICSSSSVVGLLCDAEWGAEGNLPQALGAGPALRAPALHAKVSESAKGATWQAVLPRTTRLCPPDFAFSLTFAFSRFPPEIFRIAVRHFLHAGQILCSPRIVSQAARSR